MNCSEAKFYENYLTSDFYTNTVISRRVCLPIKIASKTVIRSIKLQCRNNLKSSTVQNINNQIARSQVIDMMESLSSSYAQL